MPLLAMLWCGDCPEPRDDQGCVHGSDRFSREPPTRTDILKKDCILGKHAPLSVVPRVHRTEWCHTPCGPCWVRGRVPCLSPLTSHGPLCSCLIVCHLSLTCPTATRPPVASSPYLYPVTRFLFLVYASGWVYE